MLNILIIEDEAPIREWLVYNISNISEKFKVVGSAINGKEGYDLALNLNPDVIVTDIKMPIMDGIELLKKLKEANLNSKVIILTNHAEFSYAKQAITYGVYEYLIKSEIRPKELKELLEAINNEMNDEFKNLENIKVLESSRISDKGSTGVNYSKAIERALIFIEENYHKHISLAEISKYVFLSHEYFSRLFKEELGVNFVTYLTVYRMKKAKKLIKSGEMKISQIANEVGYTNAAYFSKSYKKYMGVSPEDDRF